MALFVRERRKVRADPQVVWHAEVIGCSKGRVIENPASVLASQPVGVVVRSVDGKEPDRGLVVEVLDQLRPVVDERFERASIAAGSDPVKVGENLLARIGDPDLVAKAIVPNPEHSPRDGSGAAELAASFQDHRLEAGFGGNARRKNRGSA
jgi:hypothetical protein